MNVLTIESPVGPLTAVCTERALCAVRFTHGGCAGEKRIAELNPSPQPSTEVIRGDDALGLRERFDAYFAGETDAFDGLTLDAGGTAFQESVWAVMLAIPFGQTRTYGSIAKELGNPSASRAVGAASGANPIPIVTPCHRVVGADGSLTGFGGGLRAKERLLEHECGSLFV